MAEPGGLVAQLNALSPGHLPGLLGLQIVEASKEQMRSRLDVRPQLLAPNGYLHAATVVGLADTTCGYGTRLHLPEGATGFTTIELKTNFLGTAMEGGLACTATAVHVGCTTQVWDAVVTAEAADGSQGRTLALFRCTQAVLWPR